MATITRTRRPRKPNAANEARKNEVELAAQTVTGDEPDYELFLRRWGQRYGENNLHRLWVQAPHATVLHFHNTWEKMGRHVKAGQKAIWLRIPRRGRDESKVTETNPDGSVFYGAPWQAFFDYSQTEEIGNHAESPPDASPDQLAEIKRLRTEARKLHPDVTGDNSMEARDKFVAAWNAYEKLRDEPTPKTA
jgi:hypothetical protein